MLSEQPNHLFAAHKTLGKVAHRNIEDSVLVSAGRTGAVEKCLTCLAGKERYSCNMQQTTENAHFVKPQDLQQYTTGGNGR